MAYSRTQHPNAPFTPGRDVAHTVLGVICGAVWAAVSGGVCFGSDSRCRLPDFGVWSCLCDRKLNSALHLVAVTQVRTADSAGRRYFDHKIDEYLALIDEHGLTKKDQTTHAMSS